MTGTDARVLAEAPHDDRAQRLVMNRLSEVTLLTGEQCSQVAREVLHTLTADGFVLGRRRPASAIPRVAVAGSALDGAAERLARFASLEQPYRFELVELDVLMVGMHLFTPAEVDQIVAQYTELVRAVLAPDLRALLAENEELSDLDAAATRRKELQAERDRAVQRWHDEHKRAEAAETARDRLREAQPAHGAALAELMVRAEFLVDSWPNATPERRQALRRAIDAAGAQCADLLNAAVS